MSKFEDNREFVRKFYFLKEHMEHSKLKITMNSVGLVTGLNKVKYLPNRRIDLFTINESVRTLANMMEQMQYYSDKDEEKE
ncbi:MAG TPA: hypothetical protein DCS93_30075 [Microscillaceae bacterium]|nr:hypothetical protein [Microscillaceae bacterium]